MVLPSSLDLKPQSDGSYKSLCPWRDDKNPSPIVYATVRGVEASVATVATVSQK